MAEIIDVITARKNLQMLTDKKKQSRVYRTVGDAKKHVLQLERNTNFPKIGLLIDKLDVKDITITLAMWSINKSGRKFLISNIFLVVQYFFIKKRC